MTFAFIVPDIKDIIIWRMSTIRALMSIGIKVLIVAPEGKKYDVVEELGCERAVWDFMRGSWNPFRELCAIWRLYRIILKWRPALVHQFTIKPNIYGTLCAKLARVPVVITTVTGLGILWTESSFRYRLIRRVIAPIYRYILLHADASIFLNHDDLAEINVPNSWLVPGEGIDLDRFSPDAIGAEKKKQLRSQFKMGEHDKIVLMISRLLWTKGVGDFVEAARLVSVSRPEIRFVLVGAADKGNPTGIGQADMKKWEEQGLISNIGWLDDVRTLIGIADLVVLPSYREGMPAVLVESAAMGKALIATDVPGCREVVRHEVNGLLVPKKNPRALAAAVLRVLLDDDTRERFGHESRAIAISEFSDAIVLKRTLGIYRKCFVMKGLVPPRGIGEYIEEA